MTFCAPFPNRISLQDPGYTLVRITISDEAKFQTQPFTFLSIGTRVGRVVTFGKKVVTFAGKFEICYDATKSCY